MTKIWTAPEAVIKMAYSESINISATAVLDTAFSSGTAIEGVMKDITVTEPTRDVDKIDLLGEDTNNFQNAELELKPAGLVEISGTAILPGDEVSEPFIYGASSAAGGTHTTYQSGKTNQSAVAILLNLDDGTDEVNYAAKNVRVTAHDTKVTGADGHFEVSWTLKCLARDFFGPQFKD